MRRRKLAGIAITFVLCVTLVACGSDKKSGGSSGGSSASPAKIVSRAVSKTTDAGSTKADISLDFTKLPGVNGEVKLSGTGEFNLKDKLGHLHLDLGPLFNSIPAAQRGALPPNAGDVDVVYADKVVYMKAPAFSAIAPSLKPWLKIDPATAGASGLEQLQNLGGGNDPSQTLKLLDSANNVTLVGKEDVRGVATTHYSATVNLDKAIAGASDQQKQQFEGLKKQTGAATLPVDVWIDNEGRARRMTTKVSSASTASAATATEFSTTIEFYDFGTKVTVDVPPNDQVSDLCSLGGGTICTTTTTKKP